MKIDTQYAKTLLIRTLGERRAACIHGLRFIYMLLSGRNIDPEIALLPVLVREGDTVIDVGASGANWTYWLHRNVGKKGSVFAFEADPYYARATDIAIRIMRLEGVKLFQFGLSDAEEEVPLRVRDSQGVRLGALSRIDKDTSAKAGGALEMVHLRRLDSLVDDFSSLLKVKLIKCDVEGYELYVFRGAASLLDQARPFVILESGNFELQGYTGRDLWEFFQRRNYVSYALVQPNTLSRTDTSLGHKGALSVNRVMIPTDRLEELRQVIHIME